MDDSRMDEIFEFIDTADVDLEEDPIRKGPKYLNNMVARCRNLTNEIQKYERETAREQLVMERQLNTLESEYEMRFNDLMSNDEDVIRQPSAKDREAKVNDILKDLRSEIKEVKMMLTDVGHVETVIQSKMRELKDVNRDLRLQIRLVEDEIQIGNFWGDEADTSKRIENKDIDLDESDMVPSEQREDDEVSPEDYEELFGSEDSDDDYDGALEAIDADTDTSNGEGADDPFQEEDEIDYDDLLSDI